MLRMVPDSHSWYRGAGSTQAKLSAPTHPRTTRITKDCLLKQRHNPRTSLFLLNMPGLVLCPTLAPQAPSSSPRSSGCVDPLQPLFMPSLPPAPALSAPPACPLPHLLHALLVSPSPLHCASPQHPLPSPRPTLVQQAFPVLRHSPERGSQPDMCWSGNCLVSMATHIDYRDRKGPHRCYW